jgi:nucleoside-diphosphate-sugar epimerase
MRILVTGASGFLGAHVRRAAQAAGMEVHTVSRSPLPDSPRHHRLDLGADSVLRIVGVLTQVAPDAVVHCAGATQGDLEALSGTNINGTHALVRALLLAGAKARLVHLGSAAEYGRCLPGVPVSELMPARPVSAYGATKLAATRIVEMARGAGLDGVVLRVFNPVGAGAPENSLPGRAASVLRRAMVDGSDLRLGPLDAVRDFVDARDVADAVLAATTARDLLLPPVLNIGSGQGVAARTLVKELLNVSGAACAVREDDPAPPRSADVPWQQGEITLARCALGWWPRRDLTDSVAELWRSS